MVDGRECVIWVEREDGKGGANPRFTFDQDRWRIPSDGLEGFGGVEYEVSTQAYAQYDGSYLLNERIPERDRTITADAWFDPAEARAEATAFFIPRRLYTVHCAYMGRSRYFTGRQYAFEVTTGNVWGRVQLTWTCLSIEPMWLSEDEKRFDIAEAKSKRGFSFVSYLHRVAPEPEAEAASSRAVPGGIERHVQGFVVGVLANRIEMTNGGNATAYPRFDITATGEVRNPRVAIEDESGAVVCEFGIGVTMRDGDRIVVDFSARPTTIEMNGENVSHLVTAGSTLATGIEVGDFTLTWDAEFGDAALHIEPTIRERYTSI